MEYFGLATLYNKRVYQFSISVLYIIICNRLVENMYQFKENWHLCDQLRPCQAWRQIIINLLVVKLNIGIKTVNFMQWLTNNKAWLNMTDHFIMFLVVYWCVATLTYSNWMHNTDCCIITRQTSHHQLTNTHKRTI